MKKGMTKKEFETWKKDWNIRIPGCKKFVCIHEFDSCAIDFLCSQGSLYETYIKQKCPKECTEVKCIDCFLFYECKEKIKID